MTFEYVSVEEAIERRGLRMVVVGDVPSPWGEAAKGILHIKGIAWVAVRLAYDSALLKEWAGQRSAPVIVYDNERPRSGWAEFFCSASASQPHHACCRKFRLSVLWFSVLPTKFAANRGWVGRAASWKSSSSS